ncbi:MAG: TetR/AcrR family transcriptional regulator [Intestinibacter bartlettii]|uniref:TetR/AcrR family transcriptional regulator n=1 Tax=Intestinibacter bartlettii TaxID=261299 RepID=UPI0026EBC07E|nr:TetR/AcrR family transcriptional regulator [Intestinibacter bartlettii]MDO5011742.1 TetR/AcrR family transcriptional regulator [Intestinibacter bartlettii]
MSNKKIDIEEQIIKKSFNLFLVNGYEKTTIRQIADSVGIGRGHLYYYFKKKEDILLYIYKTILNKIYGLISNHHMNDTELLLNYAVTQCLYTYTIVRYESLFRIYIEASKVPVIRKEYVNILIELFKKKAPETHYNATEKDIYISVAVGCAGEEELLRRYYNKDIDLDIEDIIKSVISTRLILLNIIEKKQVDQIVGNAIEIANNLNIDELLESFDIFLNKV